MAAAVDAATVAVDVVAAVDVATAVRTVLSGMLFYNRTRGEQHELLAEATGSCSASEFAGEMSGVQLP